MRGIVSKQAEQLRFLEEQLKNFMLPTRGDAGPRRRFDGPRLCWLCQSPDHLKANCPRQSPQWHSGGPPIRQTKPACCGELHNRRTFC